MQLLYARPQSGDNLPAQNRFVAHQCRITFTACVQFEDKPLLSIPMHAISECAIIRDEISSAYAKVLSSIPERKWYFKTYV